jgi:hypothetical protein
MSVDFQRTARRYVLEDRTLLTTTADNIINNLTFKLDYIVFEHPVAVTK